MSFAHTLQDMEAAQIDWYNGQFNEEASAIIQRATGATLTKEQFFSAIDATFGNRENAVRSCCALPEVMHMTFVSAPCAEGERFIGTAWHEQFDRSMSRVSTRAWRITPPSTDGNTCEVNWMISYIPTADNSFEQHFFDGFPLTLVRLSFVSESDDDSN